MRRKNLLVLLVIGLMLCSILTLQAGVVPARAATSNLADEAVSYLSNQYLAYGTSSSGLGSYDVYILQLAGMNVSGWVYNGENLPAAVTSLTQQDLQSSTTNAKELAQDLAALQALDQDTGQLLQRLQSEQSAQGFDQGTYSAFTNMPAYDLLGRTGNLSTFNYADAESYILGRRNADGSWDQSYTDFMTTAEAVRALKYLDLIQSNSTIETAITSGCNWLEQQQQPDGSFNPSGSYDDPLIDTVEAIATQKVLGLDPATWTYNGKSAVDYLEAVVPNPDGSFGSTGDVMDATWLLDGCNQLGISLTGRPLVPAFSQNGGSISTSQTVGINATLSVNQAVYCTITSGSTGTMPTVASSVYSTPFVVSSSTGTYTVEAAVYDGGLGLWSIPATATFTVVTSTGSGGGGSSPISVGVAVVGQNGQMLYGPAYVDVSPSNQWGLTVLGALDATGIHYTTTNTDYGVWVTNIDGEAMQQGGTAGWIFTVNDVKGSVGPAVANIASGDHVIWYWSSSMSQAIPTWAELTSGGSTVGGGSAAVLTPTVQTVAATSVTATSAVLNGDITSDNGYDVTDYGFLWGTSASSPANKLDVGANNQSGAFTDTLSSLTAGTTYYFEAYATNSYGTADGSFLSFTTGAQTSTTPTTPATPKALTFTDVPNSFWAYGDIENLSGLGYISGYPDGSFKPDSTITRAEFVSILGKVLKLQQYNPTVPDFSDVAQGDWFYGSVEEAVYAGIVKGYSSTFRPDDPITREEMAVILVNALNEQDQAKASMNAGTAFTDDASISDWARGFVAVAVQDGLLKGYPDDNSFRPKSDATRAEACAMIMNFLNIHK